MAPLFRYNIGWFVISADMLQCEGSCSLSWEINSSLYLHDITSIILALEGYPMFRSQ